MIRIDWASFGRNIKAYEQGDLNDEETVVFFQEMLDTGLVWKLQGHYGRTASRLLDEGLIK